MKKTKNIFPKGWNEKKIKQLIKHYDNQSEDQAAKEDQAAYQRQGTTSNPQKEFGDFKPGELDALLAEGERSIKRHGTLDGEQAFKSRYARRRKS